MAVDPLKKVIPSFTLAFNGGEKKITLQGPLLTGDMIEEIADAVAAIRAKDSDFAEDKYPMEEGEDFEEYEKRIGKIRRQEEEGRRVGESALKHAIRVNRPTLGNKKMAFELLNWWARRTNQPEVTEEEFNRGIWQTIRHPMYEHFVLTGEVVIPELYPKRT